MTAGRWRHLVMVMALAVPALTMTACARTQTPVALDGTVAIFSNDPARPIIGRESDWVQLGPGAAMALTPHYEAARPVLEVRAGNANAAMIRRIDAPLLAMPFLFWDWRVIDGPPEHPVRLVIGFADGNAPPAESALSRLFSGPEPPPYSRSLTLVWSASALQRGSYQVKGGGADGRPHARYVVRGGRENRNRWWREHLDLSQIHALAWPGMDMAASRVVFAGISAVETAQPGRMRIAGFRLSR